MRAIYRISKPGRMYSGATGFVVETGVQGGAGAMFRVTNPEAFGMKTPFIILDPFKSLTLCYVTQWAP